MQNDLSLSQSLGGLRIANPDDGVASTSGTADVPTNSRIEAPGLAPTGSTERISPSSSSPPSRVPTDPQAHTRKHSIFNILRRERIPSSEANSTSPPAENTPTPITPQQPTTSISNDSYRAMNEPPARSLTGKQYRQSMPYSHQAQQHAQFLPYQSGPMQNGSRGIPSHGSARPISGVYAAHPPPNALPSREPSYRLRSETSRSSMSGAPSRSDSRSAAMMPAGVISREASHRDRSYSQNQQVPLTNPNMPPRRSSRGMGGGYADRNGSANPQGVPLSYGPDGNPMSSNEEWKDKGAAVGLREEYDSDGKLVLRQVKKGVRDFAFGQTLGEGSYSTVVLATDRQTLKEYAVKILDKKHIIKEKKIKYVNIEKDTLNRLIEHPGIVRLYYTFQDSSSLYYVLDIASGGELLGVLKKIGSFDEECTRFYGAQILDAIEHMHNRGVIHRDLKPENVLMDDQMHVKITDFGTAKLLPDPRKPRDPSIPYDPVQDEEATRARSFVGTAEYVSPELLTDKSACKASDLWAFGCIIYQLLTGRPPFKAGNEYLTFQKIVALEYEFPAGFPPAAKDLVERLLVLDPVRRLSIEHIKNHEFFDGIRWGRGLWKMKAPRLKPYVPPAREPTLIKLNGASSAGPSAPQPVPGRSRQPTASNGTVRPQPRIITELPPPTQLDIEWSPVLTRTNERILKLGNLMVLSAPSPHSPSSKNGENQEKSKFSKFFGGNTTKKRERLVMVTSSGRILFAATGGDEKKAKSEISLLASECVWRSQTNMKGQATWCVDTRGTSYTFEDVKTSSGSADPTKSTTEEWIEALERAKDLALSQNISGSYNSETGFDIPSAGTSPSNTLRGHSVYPEGFSVSDPSGRHFLSKSQASLGGSEDFDKPAPKKTHRFSKRQSKNGLSTPF